MRDFKTTAKEMYENLLEKAAEKGDDERVKIYDQALREIEK